MEKQARKPIAPQAWSLPVDDFEALMETLHVLGDPVAMEALGLAQSGKGTYGSLNLDDPDFGL